MYAFLIIAIIELTVWNADRAGFYFRCVLKFEDPESAHPPGMVRPRASEANLRAALSFADILIARKTMGDAIPKASRVPLKGPRSIYAAFRECFPELVRNSRDRFPKNRQAVSMIELNKMLFRSGLKSLRKIERTDSGIVLLNKVSLKMNH
jgi:hypothetical protein